MVINIDRECEHKIIVKQGLVLIVTINEYINDLKDFDKKFKTSVTNVSLINNLDYGGAQISKIGWTGHSCEEACKNFVKVFNKNRTFHAEENKILLCCDRIPKITVSDLKDFKLTRRIQFSWEKEGKTLHFYAYVRKKGNRLIFTYDGTEKSYYAKSDKEVIEHILKNCDFSEQPKFTSIRRRGRLFYPTRENFIR